jgi:TolB protein
MTAPDHLRDALHDLADTVRPADLHDGAVRRSRRIARRETVIGSTAAVVVLALLATGLWRAPSRAERREPPPVAVEQRAAPAEAPSAIPSPLPTTPAATWATPSPAGTTPRRGYLPRLPVTTPLPRSRVLADLPGRVFYEQRADRPDVVRFDPADGETVTVLAAAPSAVGISPDGKRIAYEQDGALLVTGGGRAERLAIGVTTTAQAPAWSPDGARLLVHAVTPAVVEVGTGTLTPLPSGLGTGLHFRWSGDGSKLVYATSYCGLQVAGSDDPAGIAVPMLGARQPADNPDGLAACRPTSVDVTGGRVTVPLQTTGATGDDGSTTADTVVDTATGALITPPVAGTVVGMVFDARGNLLVRAVRAGVTRLSLFAPDGTLLVQATEPVALKDLNLLAYTR